MRAIKTPVYILIGALEFIWTYQIREYFIARRWDREVIRNFEILGNRLVTERKNESGSQKITQSPIIISDNMHPDIRKHAHNAGREAIEEAYLLRHHSTKDSVRAIETATESRMVLATLFDTGKGPALFARLYVGNSGKIRDEIFVMRLINGVTAGDVVHKLSNALKDYLWRLTNAKQERSSDNNRVMHYDDYGAVYMAKGRVTYDSGLDDRRYNHLESNPDS